MYIYGNMDYYFQGRYRILLAIIGCYLLPLIIYIFLTSFFASSNKVWMATALGLFLTAAGTLILFFLITEWEDVFIAEKNQLMASKASPMPIPESTIDPQLLEEAEMRFQMVFEELSASKEQEIRLEEELMESRAQILIHAKEGEVFQRQLEQTVKEFNHFKLSSEEKLEQNHLFLGEYQQTINELRNAVETKQQLIGQLESKVRDLTYEIKTLLQIAEKVQNERPALVHNQLIGESNAPYHAKEEETSTPQNFERPSILSNGIAAQLKRCLDIAQKITGGSHYANRLTRARDLSLDNNALDLRRLCDSLRSEASSPLWVYSPKENKLIFANQEIKNILGWHPEKFIQNFSEIINSQSNEWQNALAQLAYKNNCQTQLSLKTKNGQTTLLQCHMGVISTGLFRGNIIGIADKPI